MKENKILLKEIMDRYAEQGWANGWCKSCGSVAIYCPECGTNVCGTWTKNCGTCQVAFQQQEKIWAETDPIIKMM